MKTTSIRLISLLLAVIPMVAAAQNNIKSAFDAIIKCPEAQISESHTLEKSPTTGIKTGQCDIYRFVLPSGKEKLLEKVVSAFDKDIEKSYSVKRGQSVDTEGDMLLAVGDDIDGAGVRINDPDCEYIYALFLAPVEEDHNGIFRYAYGMNFKKEGGKLVGKLIVTYATTLKYRQQVYEQRRYEMYSNLSNGAYVINGDNSTQQTWFEKLMSYFQSMTQANSQTRIALATKAYKVIQDTTKYTDVTDADKEAVSEVLKGMIADKQYSETVLNKLLKQCLQSIKWY